MSPQQRNTLLRSSVGEWQKQFFSVTETGHIFGLSQWTIRSWCYSGKIASHKLGSRLMVPLAEIERLMAESERPRLEVA